MHRLIMCTVIFVAIASNVFAQEKKLDNLRTGGGSASAAQMSIWFAKEGNYYEKNGLNVELISIPGSSLALQAMLSGELPIIQAGGAGPIQVALSGTDTVIVATIAKKFNWWIFSQPNISRMEDLKGKVFGTTRFGTQSDLASRIALRLHGLDPERDVTMVQTGGPAETVTAMMTGKVHAAAISPPATLQAKRVKLKELMDLSKLDVEYHVNGLVTTRRYLKEQRGCRAPFSPSLYRRRGSRTEGQGLCHEDHGKVFSQRRPRSAGRDIRDEHQKWFQCPSISGGDRQLVTRAGKTVSKSQGSETRGFRR